jgi:hypothetical protein
MLTWASSASNLYFMFRKKTRRLMVFLYSAMLVWAQLAVSAYACPVFSFDPAPLAVAEMPSDCAGHMDSKPSPLCVAHCEQSPQTSQTASIDIPPVILVSLGVPLQPDMPERLPSSALHAQPLWLAGASPPLRIQYQVFRN